MITLATFFLLSACSNEDLSLGQIIPDAPTTLDATGISTTEINLTWNDNADSETGYRIERSLDGIEFEEIQITAANVTSFGDTGLTHSTVYYYRVAATGDYGDSPYSNVASATTGCDGATSTLCDGRCVDMLTDPRYCGDCDNACGEGRVCGGGKCLLSCGGSTPDLCVDACVNFEVDSNHCGFCDNVCDPGKVCAGGQCLFSCGGSTPDLCNDACVNFDVDRNHCGECGNLCDPSLVCSGGVCVFSCGGSTPDLCGDACVNTDVDVNHCGLCENACDPGMVCFEGECDFSCGGSTPDLCGDACVDLDVNPSNCGFCDNACDPGMVCSGGGCDFSCGGSTPELCGDACINIYDDNNHCGYCDNACDPGFVCIDGSCEASCQSGLEDCDGVCVDLENDPANCGECELACPSGANSTPFCSSWLCALNCADGWTDCDGDPTTGCEIDLLSDHGNCGSCGNACTSGAACIDGICKGMVALCDEGVSGSFVADPSSYGLTCDSPAFPDVSNWFDFDSGEKTAPNDVFADLSKGHVDCCYWNVQNGATQVDSGIPNANFDSVSCSPIDGRTYATLAMFFGSPTVLCLRTAEGRYFKYMPLTNCCPAIVIEWQRTY